MSLSLLLLNQSTLIHQDCFLPGFEDAAKADCAPSYALQFGSDLTTFVTQAEMYLMAPLLDQGYYVVSLIMKDLN